MQATRQLGLATLLFTFAAGSSLSKDTFVGRPAPDFQLKDLDGHDVRLSSFKGDVVLLDFWATWCSPCRVEIPIIERISKRFEKKDVVVMGVDSGEQDSVVRRFVDKNKMSYPVLLTADNPDAIRAYAVRALPTVVVIDKNGIIAAYTPGVNQETEQLLHDQLDRVLSSNYVSPVPSPVEAAQMWQPETPEDFLARGFARLGKHQTQEAAADAEEALKLHPDWYMAVFLRGRAAYDDKDYPTAIADFDKVIQQKPDWPQSYHYRGLAYSYSDQHQRAVPDYLKLIELAPYLPAAYNDLGWAYTELKQFDKARSNLDKAIELEPNYVRARQNRAILFGNQNNWAGELNELAIISNLAPNDQWAKDAKEAAQQQRLLPPDAQKQSQQPSTPRPDVQPRIASKSEPEYTDEARRAVVSTSVLCSLVVNQDGVPQDIQVERGAGFGLDEKAVQTISTWSFHPATTRGLPVAVPAHIEVNFRLLIAKHERQIARLNFNLPPGATRPQLTRGKVPDNPADGGPASMRVALTVAADGKPEDVSVIETTSSEWAEDAIHEIRNWRFHPAAINGQKADVKGVFELAVSSNGTVPSTPPHTAQGAAGSDPNWQPKSSDEFLARGYSRLGTHKYPLAQADAEDALKLHPDDVAALNLRGRALYEQKAYAAAIEDFDKVIRQKPDWPAAYRYRGLAYSYSGQHQRALPDYQKAIELDPNLGPAYNALGWAYCELGQLELAKQNLDKAIELDPVFILARENRVKLFARKQDLQAEKKELATILGLAQNNQWAQDTLEALLQRTR